MEVLSGSAASGFMDVQTLTTDSYRDTYVYELSFLMTGENFLAVAEMAFEGEVQIKEHRKVKKGKTAQALIVLAAVILSLALASCGGGGPSADELKTYRDLSWEGTELTVKLGTNKDTGCEWKNEFGDDSIIGYSINRKFTLSDKGAVKGQTVGILSAGFEGKREGTTTITFTTPCDWDGNEPGYAYVVTVEVAADGTIVSATGE